MTQEKIWQPKDIIYAKDVLLFLNPATKEIELWVCGKNGFCKIESVNAICEISDKLPQNLTFLNRNLEQELYDNKAFKNYKGYYTTKTPDMMHLISKIRHLEFVLTAQNLNQENFQQYLKYMKTKWAPSKTHFFALGKRDVSLSLSKMDKGVHELTKNMFFDCIAGLQYHNQMPELKYHETQHYMVYKRSWDFFKNRIPRIQNRNRFFTYYELLLYKEFLNMNYSNSLYNLSSYKDKLQAKIKDKKVLKELKKKQEIEKENSKELYKF